MITIPSIIRIRMGSEAEWNMHNPILRKGEMGLVSSGANKDRIKVGNGTTPWSGLSFTIGTTGTNIIASSTSSNITTAPDNSKLGDLILNAYLTTKTIGGISVGVGGLVEITSMSPFTCVARGNIRGAQGSTGNNGADAFPTVGEWPNFSVGATLYATIKGGAAGTNARIGKTVIVKSNSDCSEFGSYVAIDGNGTTASGVWKSCGGNVSQNWILVRRIA